jgi:thiamine pyrophosphate-dependent acetolactate synthase large subunit-like protein
MGSLATIGVQQPRNLAVVVIDNERYGETGMQRTHTAAGVNLASVAKACGFRVTKQVQNRSQLVALRSAALSQPGPVFAQVKVIAEKLPLVLPPRDGGLLKSRFRRALLGDQADLD